MTDVRYPELTDEQLARPTLGAWQRANGVTGPCEYARIALATTIAEMLWRRTVLERLDSICRFVAAGGPIDAVIDQLADLLDDIAPWIAEALTA